MQKTITLLCVLLAFSLSLVAQTVVKGKISDTLERQPVHNAVVAVLDKRDSTLLSFTRSKQNGEFSVTIDSTGGYVLLVTCPRFADFAEDIEIKTKAKGIKDDLPVNWNYWFGCGCADD